MNKDNKVNRRKVGNRNNIKNLKEKNKRGYQILIVALLATTITK